MHVIDRKPPTLKEERRQNKRISGAKDRLRYIRFKREMAAEGTIATQDDIDFLVRSFGDLEYIVANCANEGFCFGWWQGARVC
jgi:hypothetical protein